MADKSSPARRTNRVLGVLAAALIVSSVAVAFGIDPSPMASEDTVPTPGPGPVVAGSRPAETSRSWFDHSMSVEQFDYDMPELSCEAVATAITPDLCAVATSPNGDFMLVGSEGFWDPTEVDADGFAHVSLNLTVFSMRDDQGARRAISVLDGLIDQQYGTSPVRIDIFTTKINGSDVLVIHKHLSDSDADAYSAWDEVQLLTASTTGAPTVVATYRGAQLRVAATADSILLSNLRYRASGSSAGSDWYSRITLTPSESSPTEWIESLTSMPEPVSIGSGLTLVDTYQFPHRDTTNSTSKA